jgi:predicted phosphodiesterase
MRIAVISDIHSNLEALEKTLDLISTSNVHEIVCLGDIIGYGANPNECLTLLRSTTRHILLGNHDKAAVDLADMEYFNLHARVAAEWTHNELNAEHHDFIRKLPLSLTLDGLLFVHSSPYESSQWHYVITETDARENFSFFDTPICFVGHSHVPGIFCEDQSADKLIRGKKFLINVGSVGQPRDGDWRLSFGIVDTEAWSYTNIRSEYDVRAASDKIRKAGLPKILADRILAGR